MERPTIISRPHDAGAQDVKENAAYAMLSTSAELNEKHMRG
jgi:hypothetical protein